MTNLEAFVKVLRTTPPEWLGIEPDELEEWQKEVDNLKDAKAISRMMMIAAIFMAANPSKLFPRTAQQALAFMELYRDVETEEKVH